MSLALGLDIRPSTTAQKSNSGPDGKQNAHTDNEHKAP
jgi:hypothetical protein